MAELDGQLSIEDRLSAILEAQDGPEDNGPDEEVSAAPVPEIQPAQTEAPSAEVEGANASEEASAPAVNTTAQAAPVTPKPEPARSPELDQRLSEAQQTQQQAAAARDQYLNRLNAIVPQLEHAVAGEFADIKTPEDVFGLMQQDPARYNQFVIANTRLNQARQAQQQASQEAVATYRSAEQQKLIKALPDLADPVKGEAMKEKLRAYAKSQGIPDSRQARDADEVIRLHREMVMADKLKAYESSEAHKATSLAEAQRKAANAPPVQRPGAQRDTNTNEKASTDFGRFQKSGRLDDLSAALTHIL
jgi:hypothetical protein